jgi:hypothetical protein
MDGDPDEDDFTELRDVDVERMDTVGKAANGTRILFAKQEGAAVGIFGPEFVREQIAKADAESSGDPQEKLTLSGSPGAIAAFMKDAANRAAVREVAKADLSTASVNDLPDSAFAHIEPGGTKDDEGKTTPRSKRHFPVHDEAHVRNALSRAPQSPFGPKAMPKIRAAAKHFGVEVAKADGDGEPGSPAWEAQDATAAQGAIDQILAARPAVQALAQREGTEVGAGHYDDMTDVCDLQQVDDLLMQAAKLLGGFAVSERAEAGDAVAKTADAPPTPSAAPAATSPKESTVTDTQDGVTKAEGAAQTTTEQPAATDVAKSAPATGALSDAELAELGRAYLRKMAAEATTQTTGATAPADTARVIPGTETVQAPAEVPDDSVTKAAAQLATVFGEAMAPVTKQLGELVARVESQHERVEKALAKPDDRRSPLLNGSTGAPTLAERGPVQSPEFQAIKKALDEMPEGPARDEARRVVGIAAITARFSPS